MAGKIKYGKILVVIFITALIWVWADLALDEELPPLSNVKINVAPFANPNLWVSFGDELDATIDEIILKGPASKVAEVDRKLRTGEIKILEVTLDAAQEIMAKPGNYTLSLLPFLQKYKEIKKLGLEVESCKPKTLSVNVIGLVKKSLVVQCVDEGQNLVKTATIKPAQVDMFVPEDWEGGKLTAWVQLTQAEINQARHSPIEKIPYISLGGQIKQALASVKVTTPQEQLTNYTITTAALGYTLSANLQGKYKVVVTNLDEVIRAIPIKATPEAKMAYESVRYQVILEVDDSDKDKPEESLRRELVYNFPDEYVRKGEIVLGQPQPVIAQFKLVPLPEQKAP